MSVRCPSPEDTEADFYFYFSLLLLFMSEEGEYVRELGLFCGQSLSTPVVFSPDSERLLYFPDYLVPLHPLNNLPHPPLLFLYAILDRGPREVVEFF